MRVGRVLTGIGVGALAAAATFVTPALQASENRAMAAPANRDPIRIGIFTPAAADPKLAAVLSKSGMPDTGFRFTPSDARSTGNRSVLVAVRATASRANAVVDRATVITPSVSVAPIAYNLGTSVGWKKFAISTDVARINPVAVTQPVGRDRNDLGIVDTGKRSSKSAIASVDRPRIDAPAITGDQPNYSLDVGGSYSLTRNLDVTAGVRYKSERERIDPNLTDNRRDSQAVYVGTAFRF